MRFLKYLYRHKILCVSLIVLMLATSFCNFISPYVTSDIVNIGIQQRGIEYGVPYAMDEQLKQSFDVLLDNPEEKEMLNNSYDYLQEIYYFKENKANKALLAPITEPILAYLDDCYNNNLEQSISGLNSFTSSNESNVIHQKSINFVMKLNEQLNVDQLKICLDYLFLQAGILLIVFLISLIIGIARGLCSAMIALRIGKEKRLQIYESILNLKSEQIDKFTRSSLIIRSTTDIQVVQTMCLMILNQLIGAPLGAIVGIIFALKTAPSLIWVILLGVVLIIVAATLVYIWAKPKFMILQCLLDDVASKTRRIISGTLVYRAFNHQKFEYEKFSDANFKLYKRKNFVSQLLGIINPLLNLGYGVMTLLIMYFGSIDVQNGLIQTGQIMAFISYANMVVGSFVSVGMLIGSLPSTTVSADRIDEVIEAAANNLKDKEGIKYIKDKENYDISFREVSFRYQNSSVDCIKNVNFKIKKGSTVAIIGVTGSGKSTLCKLMLKMYNSDTGNIFLGHDNYKNLNTELIRDMFSFATQDSFLFSDSIKDNILYADTSNSNIKLKNSIDNACLTSMIASQPDGVEFQIQQKSKNISGGQKQRISIARALAKESSIYIFDDCFSALDFKTEFKLYKNINSYVPNRTKIFVTQKIALAKRADQILVLDNGNLVGNGSHEKLIKSCSEYIEICKSQNEDA